MFSRSNYSLALTLLIQMASAAMVLAPTAIAPVLLQQHNWQSNVIGLYISIVYFSAATSGVFATTMIQKLGPIRTSQIALLFSCAGLLLILNNYLFLNIVGAIFLGFGYGPITPASSDILVRTTPQNRFSLIFSIKQTGVPLGGALAGLLIPNLTHYQDADFAMLVLLLITLAIAILAQSLRLELDENRNPKAPWPTVYRFFNPIRYVLSHPILSILCLCSFIFSIVQLCLSSYLVTYLNVSLKWTLIAAGIGFSFAQFSGVVGRIAWSILADKTGKSIQALIGLSSLMALSCLSMLYPEVNTKEWIVYAVIGVFGCTAISWNGVYLAYVAQIAKTENAAQATAGCLFFTFIGVVVGPPIFGYMVNLTNNIGLCFSFLFIPLVLIALVLKRLNQSQP
jgi:MFS family permease